MIKRLLKLSKDTLIYSLGALTERFFALIFVPIYTRVFSPNEYGIIDLITTVVQLTTLVLIMGLDNGVARYYIDAKDSEDKKLTASTGFLYSAISSLFVMMLLLLLSRSLSSALLGSSVNSILLQLALISMPFNILSNYCLNMFKWEFKSSLYAITSVGELILRVSATTYLVVLRRTGIIGIYIAQLSTTFIFFLIRFYLTRSNYTYIFSFRKFREMLYFGAPTVPLLIAHYVLTYSDRYFLKYYSGLDEVGVYAIGYRLSSVISLFVLGFQHAWGPFMFSTYKDEDAKEVFSKIYDYAAIVTCMAFLVLSLFSREVLQIFTTPKYFSAYIVVPFISASIVIYTLGAFFAIGIGIAKKTYHHIWSSIISALLNIVLNVILIPPFGMVGAAAATIISFLALGAILMRISQKYYHVNYRFGRQFVMYLIAGLVIFASYKFFPYGLTFSSIISKSALLVGFAFIPFVLKLVGKREINYVRKLIIKSEGVA